jgi:hypothetical protein
MGAVLFFISLSLIMTIYFFHFFPFGCFTHSFMLKAFFRCLVILNFLKKNVKWKQWPKSRAPCMVTWLGYFIRKPPNVRIFGCFLLQCHAFQRRFLRSVAWMCYRICRFFSYSVLITNNQMVSRSRQEILFNSQ